MKPIVIFDIDYTLFKTQEFKDSDLQNFSNYEEVVNVLNGLKNIADLGIFSKGESGFQKKKLEKTGIVSLFEENNIHIFDDKDINLSSVLKKYKDRKVFMVDDKLSILYSAKKLLSQVITVWVKRGPYAAAQEPIEDFVPNAQVENLSEIVKIVELEIRN